MVKKASGKWMMCMDFTNLNKACPKDSYPFPGVDVLVDSTARHQLLSFMDAFLGYNQIRMHEADQEKTSFVTSQGLFCYKECGRDIPEAYEQNVHLTNWEKCPSLRGRHVGKKPKGGRSLGRPPGDIQHPAFLQHEAQPRKMRLRSDGGKIHRIHGVLKGHRS